MLDFYYEALYMTYSATKDSEYMLGCLLLAKQLLHEERYEIPDEYFDVPDICKKLQNYTNLYEFSVRIQKKENLKTLFADMEKALEGYKCKEVLSDWNPEDLPYYGDQLNKAIVNELHESDNDYLDMICTYLTPAQILGFNSLSDMAVIAEAARDMFTVD